MKLKKATNPLLKGDFPDLSIIRVDTAYYMVSTTMYFTPVAPIMKSYDLINWKIISYCTDILEDIPAFRLESENNELIGDYGRGQWASSIRHIAGKFWVMFTNNTTNKTYLFSAENPESGAWARQEFDRRFHDPSIFFDEDIGRMWVLHGYEDITLTEMEPDLSGVKHGGVDKKILKGAGEGTHIYKINGYYYVFTIAWTDDMRTVFCNRSINIEGPYEQRTVLRKGLGNMNGGVAQGGIIETSDGNWYGFFFQDRDAVGRVPVLVPMRWDADMWPVFGDADGNIPTEFFINQIDNYDQNYYVSDEFDNDVLHLAWQWNHNPDNDNWSLTERQGYLRLRTGKTSRTIYHACNTLTQRTFEPSCEGEACEAVIALEPTNMKDGDIAGIVVLQAISGFAGIEQIDGQKYVVMYTGDNENKRGSNAEVTRKAWEPFSGSRIYLKARCRFRGNNSFVPEARILSSVPEPAAFFYSIDGANWTKIGETVNMQWTMRHFTGARFGLFNYATKEAGGFVDFDFYRVNV